MHLNSRATQLNFSYPVDECMRTLKVPIQLKPYIEKHGIPQLFSQLTKEMLTEKPTDVLLSIKKCLKVHQIEGNNVPNIILLGPPQLDKLSLAYYVSQRVNCVPITLRDIITTLCAESDKHKTSESKWPISTTLSVDISEMNSDLNASIGDENAKSRRNQAPSLFSLSPDISIRTLKLNNSKQEYKPKDDITYNEEILSNSKHLTQALIILLQEKMVTKGGWIFVDFPRNKEEAQCLFQQSIVPTHVICFTSNSFVKKNDSLKKHQLQCGTSASMQKYQLTVLELKEVYGHFFREINVCSKDLAHMGEMVINIVNAPMSKVIKTNPRVVILGPRGSGRGFLGDKLAENLKLIHVHFEPKETSNEFESCKFVLSRLLEDDCQTNGYVITGFPSNTQELRALHNSENPPNRIIFLAVTDDIRLKRARDDSMDIYTGQKIFSRSEVNYNKCNQSTRSRNLVSTHPKYNIYKIVADLEYRKEMHSMMKYCGRNAIFIDPACGMDILYERVVNVILGPSPVFRDRDCQALLSFSSEPSSQSNLTIEQSSLSDINKLKFMIPFQCLE